MISMGIFQGFPMTETAAMCCFEVCLKIIFTLKTACQKVLTINCVQFLFKLSLMYHRISPVKERVKDERKMEFCDRALTVCHLVARTWYCKWNCQKIYVQCHRLHKHVHNFIKKNIFKTTLIKHHERALTLVEVEATHWMVVNLGMFTEGSESPSLIQLHRIIEFLNIYINQSEVVLQVRKRSMLILIRLLRRTKTRCLAISSEHLWLILNMLLTCNYQQSCAYK